MQLVEELKSKLTLAHDRLRELDEKRKPFALGYAKGEPKAKKRLRS